MADDAHMPIKHRDIGRRDDGRFKDIAREELSVTARAFFAPVVGAVTVVRGLLKDPEREPDPPKKRKAAA